MKYSDAIRIVTTELLKNEKTVIIGQGVTDFKRLWGTVPEVHPEDACRIIETPLSEDTISGVCLGMALNGFYPINTHIRADFSLLCFNQIINMGAKYKYMFGGAYSMPSIFRLVIGRSWGQGAQHSQSFHALLGHIPGIKVFMPATASDVFSCYKHARFELDCPTIIFEHRLLYDLDFTLSGDEHKFAPSKVEHIGEDITIVATSLMVVEALRAAETFRKQGISVEVINVIDITHLDNSLIERSVKKTGLLLVADISWQQYGLSSEVSKIACNSCWDDLLVPPRSVGKPFAPCPTAKSLEDLYHPSYADIMGEAVALLKTKNKDLSKLKYDKSSSTDFYKHFKGPF